MPKKTRTKNRITTQDAWKPRRRYSDTSDSSNGSETQDTSLDYDYQYPVNDSILDDINISLAKSNIEGEEAHDLLLSFLDKSTSQTGLPSSPVNSTSPIEMTSIVSYENVEQLERSNKCIYHFCINVCKFPLEMTRLFKKKLTPENGKQILFGAIKNLLSGFLLLYKVIGSIINYKYIIMALFAILYSYDVTRPFVKYMLEILAKWIYFGMEKSGLNNQISIFIEFVKEKTQQLFQLILLEYATPALTEISSNAINKILSSSTFQSKVAITSPNVQHTIGSTVSNIMHSPSVQLAFTGAVVKEAIPVINQHFQLVNVKLHSISTSLSGINDKNRRMERNMISTLKEINLQNIESNQALHEHIENQTNLLVNNNAMFNVLGSLPQITNAASIVLENIMGRNAQGHYLLRNKGGRKTRRRVKSDT
jgi:hypothetical protein